MVFTVNLLTDRFWPHLCQQSFESLILLLFLVSSTITIVFFYMKILWKRLKLILYFTRG